ncbi:MAG: hypothetical protein AAGF90_15250, partial [Pseudomonadota bacterium]
MRLDVADGSRRRQSAVEQASRQRAFILELVADSHALSVMIHCEQERRGVFLDAGEDVFKLR